MKHKHFTITFLVFSIVVVAATLFFSRKTDSVKTIGIILPMEHAALTEIVDGFKKTLKAEYPEDTKILVENAQGDANIQRAIIQKLVSQKVDIFVPVGTAATQMTLAMVPKQPIVSIASLYTEAERQKREPRNITGLHDEVPVAEQLAFIRAAFPHLKKMTLIYSNTEKVFNDVNELTRLTKAQGIELQKLAIHTLPDLYSISKTIAPDSQLIFILKDHMLVSGIQTLAKAANDRKIPLITSDEGSISGGGAAALGAKEAAIGSEGAKLVIQILKGKPIADIPMQDMQHLIIFVNRDAARKQNVDIGPILIYSQQKKYPLLEITEKSEK